MTVRQLRLTLLALIGAVAGAVGGRIVAKRRGATGTEPSAAPEQRFTCACGAEYRIVGTGRHRVYWPVGGDEREAVMSSECPSCGRPLDA
jgi:hypothetical protein